VVNDAQRKEIRLIYESLKGLDRLAEAFGRMYTTIGTLAISHDVNQEILTEILPNRLDRIEQRMEKLERAIVLQGADQRKPQVRSITQELRSEMFDGLVESLKCRLKDTMLERNKLLEDSARHGGDVPFYITRRLLEVNEIIDELKKEIDNLMELQ